MGARRGTAAERTSRGPRAEPATYRVGEEGRRDPGPLRGLAELQLRRHRPAELHPLPGRAAAGGRGAGLLLGEGSKGRWAPTPPGPPDTSARTLRRILLAGTATGGSDSFRGRDGAEESLLPAIPPQPRNEPGAAPCPSPGIPCPHPVLPFPGVTGWHSSGWECPLPQPQQGLTCYSGLSWLMKLGVGSCRALLKEHPKVVWRHPQSPCVGSNEQGAGVRLEWASSPGEDWSQGCSAGAGHRGIEHCINI